MGDGGESGVDVEVGRVLQPDGPGRHDQVAESDLRLQRAGRADADERGRIGDLHDLGQHDLDVVGAHPGGHAAESHAAVRPRRRRDLAVAALELDRVPARRDLRHPTGIADQQDVLGQLASLEADVVLARSGPRCVGLGQVGQACGASCVLVLVRTRGSIRRTHAHGPCSRGTLTSVSRGRPRNLAEVGGIGRRPAQGASPSLEARRTAAIAASTPAATSRSLRQAAADREPAVGCGAPGVGTVPGGSTGVAVDEASDGADAQPVAGR